MGQDRCGTCTIVSFFSYYRCLCMLQLTMHSPVMGAAVNPEAFTRIRATPPLSHHRARGADSTNGTYRSELLHSKSEWRQAQRVGNEPSSVRTVAQQFDP